MNKSLSTKVLSRSDASEDEIWVRLALKKSGKTVEDVFSLEELAERPQRLFRVAGQVGEALLTSATRNALINSVQEAVAAGLQDNTLPRFRVADRAGWRGRRFITATQVFPASKASLVVCLPATLPAQSYASQGDLRDWRQAFDNLMLQNPMFFFGASIALMPPLLALVGLEGCGFHFFGHTSLGKSTLLHFIGSARGGTPEGKSGVQLSWRTTPNALEPVAIAANDGMLLLNDMQEIPGDSRQRANAVREALYTLTSGREKARLPQAPSRTFRVVVATSHNKGLRAMMAEGGVEFDDSMTVRWIEIPVPEKVGVFKELPTGVPAADVVDGVKRHAWQKYGTPTHAFLQHLTRCLRNNQKGTITTIRKRMKAFRKRLHVNESDGAQRRISEYFALAYAAGAMAIEADILPGSRAELRRALIEIYRLHADHQQGRVAGDDPIARCAALLRDTEPRLLDLRHRKRVAKEAIRKAAGFVLSRRGKKELVFTPAQFSMIVPNGISTKRFCDQLLRAGQLVRDRGLARGQERNQTKRAINGRRRRVYCLEGAILGR